MKDCIVVGAGAAGLSAGLTLARARRTTLIVDAGRQSNLPAASIGGLLGHDHRPPAEYYAAARAELGGYPSVGESVMVERDLSIAAAEQQPLHLMHLSAAESVAALRRARDAGVRASGEVTPHHLVLTDEAVRYAPSKGITLIDGDDLLHKLQDLPPEQQDLMLRLVTAGPGSAASSASSR